MMQNTNLKKIKFDTVANEWLLFKKTQIKESTYLNYKFIIRSRFYKEFGRKTLEELLYYNYNEYVARLMNELANKTVKDIITVLKEILKYTEVKYDVNMKLSLIASPSVYKKEVKIFSDRDRIKMEQRCIEEGDIKNLGILISLYTGMRIGEVCALKWKDIDFETKSITVEHTLQRVYVGKKDTKVIYTTPKTQKSVRKIPMAKTLYEKLKIISKFYNKEAFVLSGEINKWVEPLGYRYTYRMLLKNCKIEYKKYHCLRHTFATRCIKVGMDVKSLSEILGHSNVSVTLNIYVHSSFSTKKKYIDKL